MILDKNSITARLYRWFYATKEMPQSLCPYFWKLLVMWVLIVPFYIITLPTRIFHDSKNTNPLKLFLLSLLIFGVLYVAFSMVTFLIVLIFFTNTPLNPFMVTSTVIGLFGNIGLLVIGLVNLWEYIEDKIYDARYKRKYNKLRTKEANKPSLIVEFIKATYNKYCPKIDWK
jgi:hypothetical protein